MTLRAPILNLVDPPSTLTHVFQNLLVRLLMETKITPEESRVLVPHLTGTPDRLARMFREDLLSGYDTAPASTLGTVFADGYDEVVLLRDISFVSLCAHHLLPFQGVAHVAYLPKGKVVGISKLARLVECLARRLQIQERLTYEVADTLMKTLRPRGAACVVEADHMCMTIRGVKKPGATTVTSTMLGAFRSDPAARAEVMALLRTRDK